MNPNPIAGTGSLFINGNEKLFSIHVQEAQARKPQSHIS